MRRPVLRCAAIAVSLFAANAWAQERLRADVNLVLIPVTVTDRNGYTISGLPLSSFHLFEEGVPQSIATFSSGDAPVSIGFVLDVSGSMRDNLAAGRSSIRSLLAKANPQDEALFLTFADRPDIRSPLTRDVDNLDRLLLSARSGGSTALIDSVYRALGYMKAARNSRRALVIVSDGQDNDSRYSKAELISMAVESDAQVYSIVVSEPLGTDKPIERVDQAHGYALLDDLSRATGGLCFGITPFSDIADVIARIDLALHDQYLLGYYADKGARAGWRRVQVKVDLPDARLYARSRYFAALP